MNIVVLDGYTLNPGDLSWEALHALGNTVVHDRTAEADILARAAGKEIVITNKTPITREIIYALSDLKYIGVLATGYNVVDVAAAAERGIPVCNVPTYGTESVAQATFALLLALCNAVQGHSDAVHSGAWSQSKDFAFWNAPLIELSGKTMGIIGLGRIGLQTARIAEAFGMNVVYTGRGAKDVAYRFLPLDALLAEADVISLHCPLTPESSGLINRDTLAKMKPSAFLVNTSRGALIVESDLAEALDNGAIAGAALDVLSSEPPNADNPLLRAKNCIITPHIAWATMEARVRLMDTAVQNVAAWMDGNPVNIVNM